jgi:hypothetical protein
LNPGNYLASGLTQSTIGLKGIQASTQLSRLLGSELQCILVLGDTIPKVFDQPNSIIQRQASKIAVHSPITRLCAMRSSAYTLRISGAALPHPIAGDY